jgi:N-acetyl-beta-hexosaminidase
MELTIKQVKDHYKVTYKGISKHFDNLDKARHFHKTCQTHEAFENVAKHITNKWHLLKTPKV